MKSYCLKLMLILIVVVGEGCSLMKPPSQKEKRTEQVAFQSLNVTESDQTFYGTLYLPNGAEKEIRQTLILVHEWWGANEFVHQKALDISAQTQTAVLVVDLYGQKKVVDSPDKALELATPFYKDPTLGIKRLNQFRDLLLKQSFVRAERLMVAGFCFGGTQALNWARSGQNLFAAVSFHGGLGTTLKTKSPLKTKIIVYHGDADPLVPPQEVATFKQEMRAAKADLTFVHYPKALHAFTNPQATEVGKKFNLPVAYDESAAKDAFDKLIAMLR
jgi:dienelactone hydrolase